jgi:hypothetical protein
MSLAHNPFFLLRASSRDSRDRLLELADDLSASGDPAVRASARSELTNPRQRFRAELRWLPGLSPSRSTRLVERTLSGVPEPELISGLQPLAAVNAVVSGLLASEGLGPDEVCTQLLAVCGLVESVEFDGVIKRINEDRQVAGVPQAADARSLRSEIDEWRAEILANLVEVLRRRPLDVRVALLREAVERGTVEGAQHGPLVLHELMDRMAVDVRELLASRELEVDRECDVIRKMAEYGQAESDVLRQSEFLIVALDSWNEIARPFQLSSAARGSEHEESRRLCIKVRSLAVDLHNNWNFTGAAERITNAMRRVFAELGRVAAMVDDDLAKIASLREDTKKEDAARLEWEASVRFDGTFGLVFKKHVSVSAEGVRLDRRFIALSEIARVRWGGTRHSVNGIPTGTTYSIIVAGSKSAVPIRIECRREQIYLGVVQALGRAVLWRMVVELAGQLRSGKRQAFDEVHVDDTGLWLTKQTLFKNETKFFVWANLLIVSEGGSFVISAKAEKGFASRLSYIQTDNVHVLEMAMRILWKHAGPTLSSAILDSTSS